MVKEDKDFFIHESSYVDDGTTIGENTKIWHFSHVRENASIGKNCTLGQNVLVGPNVQVGKNVKIQNNVSVYEGVTLEDDVFCGPSMVFTNVNAPRSAYPTESEDYQETRVKTGATIGANATVVCGHTIGRYALIGAGSVVTKDVPDYQLVYGVPAQLKGWVCECGEQLNFVKNTAKCKECGKEYEKVEEKVELVSSK